MLLGKVHLSKISSVSYTHLDVYKRQDVNHRAFSIDFEAYNYFVIRLNYDKGRFGCNIIFGEKLIALNNSQEWWDEADFDVFFMELQKELELRIPDKYLQAHGWL